MSTTVPAQGLTTSGRVYCEPFVYTSMVTSFGTGYHLVARGEKFSRHGADVQEMVERMVALTQAADPAHEILSYFCTRGASPLIALLRCTANRDWQGRPGGFCSALVFKREELTLLPGGNVQALDLSALPFLTQEQVEGFLKAAGGQAREALFLKGLHLKAVPAYFRPGDREFMAARLPQLMAFARRVEAEEVFHSPHDDEAMRVLRLAPLLLTANRRTHFSVLLGARRGLEHSCQVHLWQTETDSGNVRRTPLLANSHAPAGGDAAFAAYVGGRLANASMKNEELVGLLECDPDTTSLEEYWQEVRHIDRRREIAHSRTLAGLEPTEVAAALATLVRRHDSPAEFLRERFEAWQGEPEALASCLQVMRVSRAETYTAMVAALAQWLNEDPAANLRSLLDQTAIWRYQVLRDFWLQVAADVTLPPPDDAMVERLMKLDPAARRTWLERWLPERAAVFLRVPAFGAATAWTGLSAEARRAVYGACLQAAEPKWRATAVQDKSLNEFLEPRDLEFLDATAFGGAAQALALNYANVRGAGALFALWKAAGERPGLEELAKSALWALANTLDDIEPDVRKDVLAAVRAQPKKPGTTFLHGAVSQALDRLRLKNPDEYAVALQEYQGTEGGSDESSAASSPTKPAWAETISPQPKRWIWWVAAGAGVVIVLAVFFFRRSPGSPDPYLAETEISGKPTK